MLISHLAVHEQHLEAGARLHGIGACVLRDEVRHGDQLRSGIPGKPTAIAIEAYAEVAGDGAVAKERQGRVASAPCGVRQCKAPVRSTCSGRAAVRTIRTTGGARVGRRCARCGARIQCDRLLTTVQVLKADRGPISRDALRIRERELILHQGDGGGQCCLRVGMCDDFTVHPLYGRSTGRDDDPDEAHDEHRGEHLCE